MSTCTEQHGHPDPFYVCLAPTGHTEATRIPDNHLRKPCPDSPSYRTTGRQVEQWVPGTGWVVVTPGV